MKFTQMSEEFPKCSRFSRWLLVCFAITHAKLCHSEFPPSFDCPSLKWETTVSQGRWNYESESSLVIDSAGRVVLAQLADPIWSSSAEHKPDEHNQIIGYHAPSVQAYDKLGNLIWSRSSVLGPGIAGFGNCDNLLMSDGEAIFVCASSNECDSRPQAEISCPGEHGVLTKLSLSGEIIWSCSVGGYAGFPKLGEVRTCALAPNGDCILGCNRPDHEIGRGFGLACVSRLGKIKWATIVVDSEAETVGPPHVGVDDRGEISVWGGWGGKRVEWLLRLDSAGRLLHSTRLRAPCGEVGSLIMNRDGSMLGVGAGPQTLGDKHSCSPWIMKLGSSGKLVWSRKLAVDDENNLSAGMIVSGRSNDLLIVGLISGLPQASVGQHGLTEGLAPATWYALRCDTSGRVLSRCKGARAGEEQSYNHPYAIALGSHGEAVIAGNIDQERSYLRKVKF